MAGRDRHIFLNVAGLDWIWRAVSWFGWIRCQRKIAEVHGGLEALKLEVLKVSKAEDGS
ncbi:hypothetical protein M378DRAFT_157369 [Amanita muscaria Koide BX008]|uniref:Uncharacterized protein n=1 Tax=Amanita muscaria (strain Koide BX008) TaxID=946122 RepID=A0A0C2TPL0_AMAMK|nr:hypothetical protein M378DRAFT_157369 [Amanita muscaria Koide BX008]